MSDLSLQTVLCATQIVPCVMAIAQGKDTTTRSLCGALIVVAAWVGLRPYIDFVHDLTSGNLYQVLAVAAAVLGVVVAIRIKQPVLSTLIITAGALLALVVLRVVSA